MCLRLYYLLTKVRECEMFPSTVLYASRYFHVWVILFRVLTI